MNKTTDRAWRMVTAKPSILGSRQDQLFPKLDAVEIERLQRFGAVSCFAAGEALAEVGKVNPGLVLVLAGEVETTRRDVLGNHQPDLHPSPGLVHGRARSAGRPPFLGRCPNHHEGASSDHPAREAQGVARGRGRNRREDHAGPHPAPCRLDRGRCRRPDHHRPGR